MHAPPPSSFGLYFSQSVDTTVCVCSLVSLCRAYTIVHVHCTLHNKRKKPVLVYDNWLIQFESKLISIVPSIFILKNHLYITADERAEYYMQLEKSLTLCKSKYSVYIRTLLYTCKYYESCFNLKVYLKMKPFWKQIAPWALIYFFMISEKRCENVNTKNNMAYCTPYIQYVFKIAGGEKIKRGLFTPYDC